MLEAIGIDLGTSKTCVAYYRGEDAEIVPDDGRHSFPSCVAFTNTGRLIGEEAKSQAGMNPANTVFGVLRLVGRKFSDSEVQSDLKYWPFRVGDLRGDPVVSVIYEGEPKIFTTEEILAMILGKAKRIAERHLGIDISQAYITVPAYFNYFQRRSVCSAAAIASLGVLGLSSAPVAATIQYTIKSMQLSEERLVLVVDIGAGTTDITLSTIEEGVIEVLSTASTLHLGGSDFDQRLINYCLKEFGNVPLGPRLLHRLRTACERAKCELSSRKDLVIEVDSMYEGRDLRCKVTRQKFEELCQDLFRSVLDPIERVLRDGKRDKSAVHEVIVIGGSSRIPKIQELLSTFFNGKAISRTLNPDESAASGAAVRAFILAAFSDRKTNNLLLLDVLPITVGVEDTGGLMKPIIKRNTILPTQKTEDFTNPSDSQTSFKVSIYWGERVRTKDNVLLGQFEVEIPPKPRGVCVIQVSFHCDYHHTLKVTATVKSTGKSNSLTISGLDTLPADQIETKIATEKRFQRQDEKEADRISQRSSFEAWIYSLKRELTESSDKARAARVNELVDAVMDWLDEHELATASEYKWWQAKLIQKCYRVASRQVDQMEA
jgi:heat shock protein 1/8